MSGCLIQMASYGLFEASMKIKKKLIVMMI